MKHGMTRWGLLTALLVGATACHQRPIQPPVVDSESHWMEACAIDADCGDALACLCGVCTVACEAMACDAFDDAICAPVPGCGMAAPVCLPECAEDADCDPGMRCADGACQATGDAGPIHADVDGRVPEPIGIEFDCDGVDEDGDGRIDEGTDGPACRSGVGACRRAGRLRCVDAALVCDAVPAEPAEEACNGIDDDCDGIADEGDCPQVPQGEGFCDGRDDDGDGRIDEGLDDLLCHVGIGACLTWGNGACVDGRAECDAWQGDPTPELCNDIDDDCDGAVDEVGVCDPPNVEVCNGADDDADGAVDEALDDGGCGGGVGACRARGRRVCVDGAFVCDVVIPPPGDEVCNGIDDDCDAMVDEAGVCDVQSPEVDCDGADEDGDGAIDEGIDAGPCGGGIGACAVEGRQICRDGAIVCSAEPIEPRDELCNRLDDDCDGHVDEAPECGPQPDPPPRPEAIIVAPAEAVEGEEVILDGRGSEPVGAIVSYEWRAGPIRGDEVLLIGPHKVYVPTDQGPHSVVLFVTHENGEGDATQAWLQVADVDPVVADVVVEPAPAGQATRVRVECRAGNAADPLSGVRVDFGGDATVEGPPGEGPFEAQLEYPAPGRYRVTAQCIDEDSIASQTVEFVVPGP